MASSTKESLHNVIERLTDEEAEEILDYTEHLQARKKTADLLKRLEGDSTFKIPSKGLGPFPKVKTVKGNNIPASELLVKERR